jgi:membrane-bound lytic murein transglycosylase
VRIAEDVGGAVRGNRIDIYVDKNARKAASIYNGRYGDKVDGVIVTIYGASNCPKGSVELGRVGAHP